MALPLKTNADDVRTIVKYLKTKPTGATLADAKAAVTSRVVDPRKLAAYSTWGVVSRQESRLKLTDRGIELARHPEHEITVFSEIISSIKPYRSVIEWAHHQSLSSIDTNDVAAHWHEHHLDVVGDANENTLRENAVCFFNVAGAAGLGKLVVGRGGNSTRLELQANAITTFVEDGPADPPWEQPPEDVEEDGREDEPRADAPPEEEPARNVPGGADPLRVFISHGSNHSIVEQIEVMLGLADIVPEVAVTEETAAIPVPEKVLNSMRRCHAGIIAVTVDESRKDEEGNFTLNENVLIEIGSAFVLYDQRVVLVWDKRLAVPSNLQGLYRCEFEGDELTWSAGMKLMKAIQGFKKPPE